MPCQYRIRGVFRVSQFPASSIRRYFFEAPAALLFAPLMNDGGEGVYHALSNAVVGAIVEARCVPAPLSGCGRDIVGKLSTGCNNFFIVQNEVFRPVMGVQSIAHRALAKEASSLAIFRI